MTDQMKKQMIAEEEDRQEGLRVLKSAWRYLGTLPQSSVSYHAREILNKASFPLRD